MSSVIFEFSSEHVLCAKVKLGQKLNLIVILTGVVYVCHTINTIASSALVSLKPRAANQTYVESAGDAVECGILKTKFPIVLSMAVKVAQCGVVSLHPVAP